MPILRIILCEIDCFSQFKFNGKELYITSIFRARDKGVHGCWRGTDARTEHTGKAYYTKKEIDTILSHFNQRWVYDPKRPQYKVLIYHKIKGGVFHLHAQVHKNTIKRCAMPDMVKIPREQFQIIKKIIDKIGEGLK